MSDPLPPGLSYRDAKFLESVVGDLLGRGLDPTRRRLLPAVESVVNAELALILYRAAVALGLHELGAQALTLRSLQQAEEELSKARITIAQLEMATPRTFVPIEPGNPAFGLIFAGPFDSPPPVPPQPAAFPPGPWAECGAFADPSRPATAPAPWYEPPPAPITAYRCRTCGALVEDGKVCGSC